VKWTKISVSKYMKTQGKVLLLHGLAAGAMVLLAQNAQSQTTVYNNTSGYNGNFNYNNANPADSAEAGNEVVLAGSALSDYISSFVVQFDLISSGANPLAGAPTGNEEVEIDFYDNDGNLVSGAKSPGTPIWSSGFSTMSQIGLTYFTEGSTLSYNPGVTVPQDFTWTMTFKDVPVGESAGLGLFSESGGPSVGGNFEDAWVNTGSGWQLDVAATGSPSLQFGAMVVAVPEPGTIVLGLMGACAFLARRRKS
jgi:hypothetical protein